MKKTLAVLILTFIPLFAKFNVVVSIEPEAEIVQSIGGKSLDSLDVMVKKGDSPHTYEPKPSQMRAITEANLYFAIGVEFEKSWLSKFKNQNKNLKIVDISEGVDKIDNNPHIWLSPKNLKVMAKNIYNSFVNLDKNSSLYKKNLDRYIESLDNLDKKIKDILKGVKKRAFLVFHPSWDYFARDYNLTQIAVEIDGKTPKPRDIIRVIKLAKKNGVSAIITQEEFSDKFAKVIAKELNIDIIKLSPLDRNISKSLLQISKVVAKNANR